MTGLLLFSLLGLGSSSAATVPHVFGVHIGVNRAPADSTLAPLRYADDDAVRFANLTRSFAQSSVLLAALDRDTQLRHRDAAGQSRAPSWSNLSDTIDDLAPRIQQAQRAGGRAVVWLSYSGHGTRDGPTTRLTFSDQTRSAEEVRGLFAELGADEVHFFIDACHAQGLVSSRGTAPAGKAETRALSGDEIQATFATASAPDAAFFAAHPNYGAVFAAGLDANTHEWSQIQSGVFTHEIVSALSGLADVNLDGRITYSELCAFVSAANRAVADPRARVHVVAHPPQQDARTTLVDLRWLSPAIFLVGRAPPGGRVAIDEESGSAWAEANLERGSPYRVWLSPGTYRVRLGDVSGTLTVAVPGIERADQLSLLPAAGLAARGPDASTLADGLFVSAYGRRYYEGFADRAPWVPEVFGRDQVFAPEHFAQPAPVYPWLLLGAGAGAAVLAGGAAAVSGASYVWFAQTRLQREAVLSAAGVYGGAATGVAAGVAALGLAGAGIGALLWFDPDADGLVRE